MKLDQHIENRFNELEKSGGSIRVTEDDFTDDVNDKDWYKWSTSVLNLLESAFGSQSTHLMNFKKICNAYQGSKFQLESALGVFAAAKEDYEGGYIFSLETSISGKIFGDFIALAKQVLSEDQKNVAAVLACAALEDALKRYARIHNLDVDDKNMQSVVSALKSKGLVSGSEKELLDTMPKIRDWAMHANWDKLTPPAVMSVIGFVEQFLLDHF